MQSESANAREIISLVSEFDLVQQATTLLITDMQNFVADPDYGWGPVLRQYYPATASYFFSRLSNLVIPNISELLIFFRSRHLKIIFLTVGPHLSDGTDYLHLRNVAANQGHAPKLSPVGTKEHQIIGALRPLEDEIVLNKVSQGAFTSTGIDLILRNLGISTLVVAGVHTNGCVETTARQAVDLGYKTVLVEDATAAFDQNSHDATMQTFRRLLGQVLTAKEVINRLTCGTHS